MDPFSCNVVPTIIAPHDDYIPDGLPSREPEFFTGEQGTSSSTVCGTEKRVDVSNNPGASNDFNLSKAEYAQGTSSSTECGTSEPLDLSQRGDPRRLLESIGGEFAQDSMPKQWEWIGAFSACAKEIGIRVCAKIQESTQNIRQIDILEVCKEKIYYFGKLHQNKAYYHLDQESNTALKRDWKAKLENWQNSKLSYLSFFNQPLEYVATPQGIVFNGRSREAGIDSTLKFVDKHRDAIEYFQEELNQDLVILYSNGGRNLSEYSDETKFKNLVQSGNFSMFFQQAWHNSNFVTKYTITARTEKYEVFNFGQALNYYVRKMDKPHIYWKVDRCVWNFKEGKKRFTDFLNDWRERVAQTSSPIAKKKKIT
eukprot:GHVP01064320.1.p1 GENE.GHVP01064320.1~~GHVP01064320.1.p1  ORF type:complete len:386 (+),score=58.42 GHVP01064320.1:57-1160(+)